MLPALDSRPRTQPDRDQAIALLRLLPVVKKVLDSREITPRTSGGVLRIGGGKKRGWSPSRLSEVEAIVFRHAWEVEAARLIYQTLAELELTFLEAQVLNWCYWKDAPLERVADFLDVRVDQLRAAEETLLAKVVAAMGPVHQELVHGQLSRRVAAGR